MRSAARTKLLTIGLVSEGGRKQGCGVRRGRAGAVVMFYWGVNVMYDMI